jgi:hypothetical protein
VSNPPLDDLARTQVFQPERSLQVAEVFVNPHPQPVSLMSLIGWQVGHQRRTRARSHSDWQACDRSGRCGRRREEQTRGGNGRDYPLAAARQVGLVHDCDWNQLTFGAEYQDHAEQSVEGDGGKQPPIPDEPVDALLVVAESGLSLEPTGKSGRLQGFTVRRGEREQCQIGQLCEPESRTEPTAE